MSWGSQVGYMLAIVWLVGENTLAVWPGCPPNAIHHTHPPPADLPTVNLSTHTEAARVCVAMCEQILCVLKVLSLLLFILHDVFRCIHFTLMIHRACNHGTYAQSHLKLDRWRTCESRILASFTILELVLILILHFNIENVHSLLSDNGNILQK